MKTIHRAQGGVAGQQTGTEWVVDALACEVERLRDLALIGRLCDQVVDELGLKAVGIPQCHQFPPPGGVTALYLLSESHLACHTYPEHGLATFNLYCCRERPEWPWSDRLQQWLGAGQVDVQQLPRGLGLKRGRRKGDR